MYIKPIVLQHMMQHLLTHTTCYWFVIIVSWRPRVFIL